MTKQQKTKKSTRGTIGKASSSRPQHTPLISLAAEDCEEGWEALDPLPLTVKKSDPLYNARIRKRYPGTEGLCEGTIHDIQVRTVCMARSYFVEFDDEDIDDLSLADVQECSLSSSQRAGGGGWVLFSEFVALAGPGQPVPKESTAEDVVRHQ